MANGDHHRKPWLDTRQRKAGHEEPSPSGHIDVTAPASTAQGTSWKKKQNDAKSQNVRKSAMKVSPRTIYITKTEATAISVDTLMFKGEAVMRSFWQRTKVKQWRLGKGKLASSGGESSYWLSNTELSSLKPFVHKQQNRLIRLNWVQTWAYIHVTIIIKEKESGGVWGRVAGRDWREVRQGEK